MPARRVTKYLQTAGMPRLFAMQKTAVFGCLGVAVVVGLIMLVLGAGSYNKLVGLRNNVDVKWAQVENDYQRRADLIPNLVNTVSGAANFEKSTLTEVINARANATRPEIKLDPSHAPDNAADIQKFSQAQEQLGGALSRLLVTRREISRAEGDAEFPRFAGATRRHRKPDRRCAAGFQRVDARLQQRPAVVPDRVNGGSLGFKDKPPFHAREGSDVPPTVNFGGTPDACVTVDRTGGMISHGLTGETRWGKERVPARHCLPLGFPPTVSSVLNARLKTFSFSYSLRAGLAYCAVVRCFVQTDSPAGAFAA